MAPTSDPKTGEPLWEGWEPRECGEHRTVGSHRAWCYDCTEWCYPDHPGYPREEPREAACKGCYIGDARMVKE